MTKQCKACKEEIDSAATKCPKCQAYQRWFRNPQLWPGLVVLPFVIVMLWNASTLTRPPNFADAKRQVSVSVANENAPSSGKTRLITVAIDNRTGKTWKRPKFQVESLDANQNVLTVEHVSAYDLVIAPHAVTTATLELRLAPSPDVVQRRVAVTDADSSRW